ncbi:MAG: response regulator, partial [Candidatus Aminicenantes bacterium]|nr:response regulator [Candidatus Aminicenantes bacterium]
GFEVTAFGDGLETVNFLGEINPDAVLLNLSLPLKDGYEVGRWVTGREEFKKMGLVFLKNAFEPVDPEKLREIEYDEIVEKPFDSEKLARLVRDIIDRKKGPTGFPEESLIEDIPPTGALPPLETREFSLPVEAGEVEEKIKAVVREEILSAERELEKRLRASLLAEFKAWLEKGKQP